MAELETLLALVEGWVDTVVAEAVGDRLPGAPALRETLRRRRATGGPAEQTFATLIGLELRPRRLRAAADLWREIGAARGTDGRDALWAHPDLLPTGKDLDDPSGFVDRDKQFAELLAGLDDVETELLGAPGSGRAGGRRRRPGRAATTTQDRARAAGLSRRAASGTDRHPAQTALDGLHRLIPVSTACFSMAASSASSKARLRMAARLPSSCSHRRRPDQHRRHPVVTQRPGQRHRGQRLTPAGGDLVERPDVRQRLSVSRFVDSEPPREARESAGIPSRYRSVSMPWASGENAMQPTPSSPRVSSSPSSIHRLSIEYDGWWISSGVPRSARIAAARSVRSGEYDEIPAYNARPRRPRCAARPSSPPAGSPDPPGVSRRCPRNPAPSGPARHPARPTGTSGSPNRRTDRATCRNPPWWR